MTLDLFDQTLLFAVNGAVWMALVASALLLWHSLAEHKMTEHLKELCRRKFMYRMYWIIGGAIVMSIVSWAIVQSQFRQDDIPVGGVAWIMPVYLLLGFLVLGIRSVRRAVTAGVGLVMAVCLVGLIVNNYYHYFSTPIAALQAMGIANATVATSSNANDRSSPSARITQEQYYQAPIGQPAKGELSALMVPSSSASFVPRVGRIYLPPALRGNDMIRLPVIVLLAGYPGSPLDWEQAGLFNFMNDFAAKHKGLAPVVAVVDFAGEHKVDTECVDSRLGTAETYLTKDVPAYLKAHYQVATDPLQWTIGGYSAGGTCGSLVALRNPSVYRNFMNISGDAMPGLATEKDTLNTLFNGSVAEQQAHTPDLLLKAGNPLYSTMHGWYYYADSDKPAIVARIKQQAALAQKAGIDTQLRDMKGHHSFEVWKQGYLDGLPWLMNKLRLTQP